MTNLDMETAEQYQVVLSVRLKLTNVLPEDTKQYHLQVANYGIGGHYQPHVDTLLVDAYGEPDIGVRFHPLFLLYQRTNAKTCFQKLTHVHGAAVNGDRIATVLFYVGILLQIIYSSM